MSGDTDIIQSKGTILLVLQAPSTKPLQTTDEPSTAPEHSTEYQETCRIASETKATLG